MTNLDNADQGDDLYLDLLAHMASHPSNQSTVQTDNPLHYSFPEQPHGAYAIPYALSQEIAPLCWRAVDLQALWLDGEQITLTDDGEVLIPDGLLLAARSIQANSVAIFAELHKPSLKSIRGKANKLAAFARLYASVDDSVTPVQVWAMLVLCQYIAWFDRLKPVLEAFSIQADKAAPVQSAGIDSDAREKAIFNEAVAFDLADRLRPLLNPIAGLLADCDEVAEEAGLDMRWQHPDLASYCDRLDAYRWQHTNTSALPQNDEDLAGVKLLMDGWFSRMVDERNNEARLRDWQRSPFPVLIGGVQAVLHAIKPTWQGQLDHYAAVCSIPTDGLSSIETKCIVLLRQLFVTKQRNIDGKELQRLHGRLDDVVGTMLRDAPQWVEHQHIVRDLDNRRQKDKQATEQRRKGGSKTLWASEFAAWRTIAVDIWRESPKCAKTKVADIIIDAYANGGYLLSIGGWQPLESIAADADKRGRTAPSLIKIIEQITDCQPAGNKSKRGRPSRQN